MDDDFRNQQNAALAAKGRLLLTVDLRTPEQADEIMQWMYASDKPMSSTLVEVAWDKTAIPTKQAEALTALVRATQP